MNVAKHVLENAWSIFTTPIESFLVSMQRQIYHVGRRRKILALSSALWLSSEMFQAADTRSEPNATSMSLLWTSNAKQSVTMCCHAAMNARKNASNASSAAAQTMRSQSSSLPRTTNPARHFADVASRLVPTTAVKLVMGKAIVLHVKPPAIQLALTRDARTSAQSCVPHAPSPTVRRNVHTRSAQCHAQYRAITCHAVNAAQICSPADTDAPPCAEKSVQVQLSAKLAEMMTTSIGLSTSSSVRNTERSTLTRRRVSFRPVVTSTRWTRWTVRCLWENYSKSTATARSSASSQTQLDRSPKTKSRNVLTVEAR